MRVHLAAAVLLCALLVGCGQAVGRGAAYSSSGSGSGSGEDLRDTLAVMVLLTDTNFKGSDRIAMLRASIRLAAAHLGPTTPYRHYVFTLREGLQQLREGLAGLLPGTGSSSSSSSSSSSGGRGGSGSSSSAVVEVAQLRVAEVPRHTWELPEAAEDSSLWHGHWSRGYRLMGDWRLSSMCRLARELGHRYVLQFDDDSYIVGKVPSNLVADMDAGGYSLGAQRLFTDSPLVTWGLPELARFFLLTHPLQPPPSLWAHCDPPDLSGLHSALGDGREAELQGVSSLPGLPRRGGWDRQVLNGNCLAISLDFYFSPMVQRFIHLCRASGAAAAYRWNEQSVLGMVNHLFVAPHRLANLSFPYVHKLGRRYKEALQMGGLEPEPEAAGSGGGERG